MNRKERRKLERQGKLPKAEPVYLMKPSEIKNAALKGPGEQAMMHEIHQQCLEADKALHWIWTPCISGHSIRNTAGAETPEAVLFGCIC